MLVSYFLDWWRIELLYVHSSDAIHSSIVANSCPLTMHPSDGCDGGLKVIRGESGTVTSPRYPSLYSRNLECLYAIDVSGKIMADRNLNL